MNQYAAACPQRDHESLLLHQLAQQLRIELSYREAFNRYCEWYAAIALEHQADLTQMQLEPQRLQWATRKQPQS